VVQLPPGASLSRTDAVNRRVVEMALKVPGILGAVNIVGFSGATFTNAPNSGAIFFVLDPFDERAKHADQSAAAIQAKLFALTASIQEALIIVVTPPPVRGVGNAGGLRNDGTRRADTGPRSRVLAVRDFDATALSGYRPYQGTASWRQRAGRVLGAANLSRLVLCQRLKPVWPHIPRRSAGRQRVPQ